MSANLLPSATIHLRGVFESVVWFFPPCWIRNRLGLAYLLGSHLSLFFLPLNWSDELLREKMMTHVRVSGSQVKEAPLIVVWTRDSCLWTWLCSSKVFTGLTAARHFLPRTQRWDDYKAPVWKLISLLQTVSTAGGALKSAPAQSSIPDVVCWPSAHTHLPCCHRGWWSTNHISQTPLPDGFWLGSYNRSQSSQIRR